MKPTPTLRRLNDRERYWGLSWPEWAAAVAGAGLTSESEGAEPRRYVVVLPSA